jgi:hypothetical protein
MRLPTRLHPQLSQDNIKLVAASTPDIGCFVEIGVYEGGMSLALSDIVKRRGCEQHLFDIFEYPWHLDLVRHHLPHATVHVGRFPETMPEHLPDIAFCLFDTNDGEACGNAIELLYPRLVPGGIMMFTYLYALENEPHYRKWGDVLRKRFPLEKIKTVAGKGWLRYPYVVKDSGA